jgi:hypothetical protein
MEACLVVKMLPEANSPAQRVDLWPGIPSLQKPYKYKRGACFYSLPIKIKMIFA